jgi:hypothetical protein
MANALDLLRRVSWQAEKLVKARGALSTYVVITENEHGHSETTEQICDNAPAAATDDEALDALRCQLRIDFARDSVRAYAIAFLSQFVEVMAPSILHYEPSEQRCRAVVALEAHDPRGRARAHSQRNHPRRPCAAFGRSRSDRVGWRIPVRQSTTGSMV